MKGMVEEMFYFVIIILAIFGLFVFYNYERGTKGAEVTKAVEERTVNEEVATALSGLFNNMLPFVEKTYMEAEIDSILLSAFNKEPPNHRVWYGSGIGELNVSEIIPPLLEAYAQGRLKVIITTPNGTDSYGGNKNFNVIYSHEALIPVPEERVGKVSILLG